MSIVNMAQEMMATIHQLRSIKRRIYFALRHTLIAHRLIEVGIQMCGNIEFWISVGDFARFLFNDD